MSTIIIGLGNPVRGDDGVGLSVARMLRDQLRGTPGVEVEELWAGGLRLVETMIGHERALVVDAMTTGLVPPGTVRRLTLEDLESTRNVTCIHDTSLPTALELWRRMGAAVPSEICFWGIEAGDTASFKEELSESVARAVPKAAQAILEELHQHRGGGQ